VRLLRAAGEQVEVQNYIDNTGVQVADVVVGVKYLENKTLDQVKAIDDKFDYYCWDLYARVGAFYEEDASRFELRARTLHEIEAGEGETYEMADYISTRVLHCHLATMFRVGVEYDVLPRESDVLHLHIWERAFDLLKERQAIEFETEGRLSGCWVMRSVDDSSKEDESEHEADKVIVRSNGTVTYTGKDIAFHLWKLGQLGLDFYYTPFHTYPDGHVAWITTSEARYNDPTHPKFGNAAAYFNVIDIGQSYPQHYVKLGVMAVDHDQRVERSAHLAYEKVVLSPAAAEELGQKVSEDDRKRGAISMSGRKGLGVKADDLIDELEADALAEVASRHPQLSLDQQRAIAHKIAVGALRYFLLKYTRTSIISFDFKEALAMVGETGVYCQNAVVRANSIFRKLVEAGIEPSPSLIASFSRDEINQLFEGEGGDELWSLVYLASRLPDVIRGAVASLEPAHLAKWSFQLAQTFNVFYEKYHILSEPSPARRALLIAITFIVRRQLVLALDTLGIKAPERM
jgi:arginyl-tRNA synthetase